MRRMRSSLISARKASGLAGNFDVLARAAAWYARNRRRLRAVPMQFLVDAVAVLVPLADDDVVGKAQRPRMQREEEEVGRRSRSRRE